jgi:hypothetical protein
VSKTALRDPIPYEGRNAFLVLEGDETHDAHDIFMLFDDERARGAIDGCRPTLLVEPETVDRFGHRAEVSSATMLQLVRLAPVSDEREITFEAPVPPTMTTDLAAALAQLVRSSLARQNERPEQVA